MDNKKLLKKEYLVLAGLVPLIIVVAFVMLVVQPRMAELNKISREIGKKNQDIEEAQKVISSRLLLEKEIKDITDRIDFYVKKLPQEKGTPWLLEELTKIADECHIRFVSIEPMQLRSPAAASTAASDETKGKDKESQKGVPVSGKSYIEVPIRMRIACGFHELGKFINMIENSERFMKVSEIEVKANSEVIRKHNVTLVVSTFVMEDSQVSNGPVVGASSVPQAHRGGNGV
jgi:Tfp pilus assembly protein PilO